MASYNVVTSHKQSETAVATVASNSLWVSGAVYRRPVLHQSTRDLHGPGDPAGRAGTDRVEKGWTHEPTTWNGPGFLIQRAGTGRVLGTTGQAGSVSAARAGIYHRLSPLVGNLDRYDADQSILSQCLGSWSSCSPFPCPALQRN